ncbi:major facilitator superfamily protein [Actinidia rufa]|uniref:Major facilitator superfamily protein n=1 Tax=Actinidia rufa TaxID=165716 RepID=A0A7J0GNY1_9ERIC|nr:major facilitator superfamily protein [Actinidia rufa]
MADVVVDAMIAEAVRVERASFAGDLQSISWMAMAFGGICGSLLGGYALTNLQIENIFLLFSILPAMQLFSCGLIKEDDVGVQNPYFEKKEDQRKSKKRLHNTSKFQVPEKDGLLVSRWFQSLRVASSSLLRAFRQPIILRPMSWFFLAHVTVPNLSTVMFYYQTEFLNLEASFLGTVRVVGWLGLMLGTLIYNRCMKKMKLRRILMWAHIGLSFLSLLDMVLVSRTSAAFGISDKFMVLGGSALADAVNQFKLMPFLILSGQLCPPGIEGTLFALFMSINNFGSTLGSFVGAGLASALNISSGSFDNLLLGVGIQVVCTFIPVAFLFLIPKDATGISA